MIDLTPFVGKSDARAIFQEPWSAGDFSYATNGHIIVRVPRRPEIKERSPVDPKSIFDEVDAAAFSPYKHIDLPVTEPQVCDCLDGRKHDCPDCKCVCDVCSGTGRVPGDNWHSLDIDGRPFALKYIRLIQTLPDLEISFGVDREGLPMIVFKFDGGFGALMGLRHAYQNHHKATR